MRFCPHCGAPLMAGARFCVECGRQLSEAAAPAAGAAASDKRKAADASDSSGLRLTNAFIAVFFGITIAGLGAAAYILLRTPTVVQTASSEAPTGASSPTAGTLPPGHPKIQLPTEARTFIDQLAQDARNKPKDISTWNKLGAVSMRAALFDPSYYDRAAQAYAHVLKLDPNNLDALRGIGDVYYDRNKYDEAIAAYEHYLKQKPKDPEVLTDLGTMYLYTGNADQAIVQYKKAIALKPDFYQAYYNMGVAYGEQGDKANAAIVLTKAISLAPDDAMRKQAVQAFTKITGMPPKTATQIASSLKSGSPRAGAGADASAQTFKGAMEAMVRNLPVAGNKVASIEWPSKYRAKVMMSNFPMDAMPPFARDKFLSDLKTGIANTKETHKVTAKVEVDIVDQASGRVMQTVTE
jgi:tetratricopeptide (TPR) repeat protein